MVAETPDTACRNSGRKIVDTNMAADTTNPMATEMATTRLENSRSGSMGSGARRSRTTNRAPSTMEPAISAPMVGDVHAYCLPPHTDNSIRHDTEATRSAPPR